MLLGALAAVVTTQAATRYVNLSNATPAPPYANWASAANSIQDAVDAAETGDEILVTNGVYQGGAREVYGVSNRVAVTKPITLRSVNGPEVTQIVGYRVPGTTNGPAAVRCVYLTGGAVLSGFTLTNGATQSSGDWITNTSAGGVYCDGVSAVASNCVLVGNSAYFAGGGSYSGTLNNCKFLGNVASQGGGARSGVLNNCVLSGMVGSSGGATYGSTLNNCTLTGNSGNFGGAASRCTLNNCILIGNSARSYGGGASECTLTNCLVSSNSAAVGGGTYYSWASHCTITGNTARDSRGGGACYGTLNNCIIYFNTARFGDDNYYGNYPPLYQTPSATLNYCCTTPLPAYGTGNLIRDPELASASRLSASSPCRGRGNAAYTRGVDLGGEPWGNPPSIGSEEYWSGSVTGAVSVAVVAAYTNVAVGFEVDLQAIIGGRVSASRWDFGDGMVLSNRPWATHAWAAAGDYMVVLRAFNETFPDGVTAHVSVRVRQEEHFVALNNPNAASPYTNWTTAAKTIQDAVGLAVLPGARIWVSNGVYQTGARAVYGMSNRLAVTKPVLVQSVNGPAATHIKGYQVPGTTNGPAAVRCAYLTNGAVLSGFTLTNGATQNLGDAITNQSGGAVWCESSAGVVSNCVLTGNSAFAYGGGACFGTFNNCSLAGNAARTNGGGAKGAILNGCQVVRNSAASGGGVSGSTLNSCTLTGNSASSSWWGNGGGGANGSTLENCSLDGNTATFGGGAYYSLLNNCTLTGNLATTNGGGIYYGTLNNCIAYYNNAPIGPNCGLDYYGQLAFKTCCTTPMPTNGLGHITNAPRFVDLAGGDLRLAADSPCINAGRNAYAPAATDLDGNPRATGGTVDLGAYEFQTPTSLISYAWLLQYGLPTDGSADFVDADADGLNNWEEWRCLTDPTNALSHLRLLVPTPAGSNVVVSWQGVPGVNYALDCSTNLSLAPAFQALAADLPGGPGTTRFTDTNAAGGFRCYRVRVP
jgi:hypothetical protein